MPRQPLLTSRDAPWEDLYLEQHADQPVPLRQIRTAWPCVFLQMGAGAGVEYQVAGGPVIRREPAAGELTILPAAATIAGSAQATGEFLYVAIDPRAWARALPGRRPEWDLIPRHAITDPLLQSVMASLLAEARSGYASGAVYARSLASMLITHLAQGHAAPVDRRPAPAGALPRGMVDRVAEHVEAHLDAPLSLADLAAIVDLSPFHFARTFKRACGLSVHQFVLRRRVERARDLLLQGVGVVEAARRVGFWDQSHLSVHFKRRFGQTPRRFAMGAPARAA
jgi:AraC family transcriptional regulator